MLKRFPNKFSSGFTLVEALIVIALIAILAGLAAPSFIESLNKKRLTQATEAIFNDIVFARSEAIKQNRPVEFRLDTANACYGLDDNTDTACACAGTNPEFCTINLVSPVQKTENILNGATVAVTSGNNLITFSEFGTKSGTSIDTYTVSFAGKSESITINPVGRVKYD